MSSLRREKKANVVARVFSWTPLDRTDMFGDPYTKPIFSSELKCCLELEFQKRGHENSQRQMMPFWPGLISPAMPAKYSLPFQFKWLFFLVMARLPFFFSRQLGGYFHHCLRQLVEWILLSWIGVRDLTSVNWWAILIFFPVGDWFTQLIERG